MDDSRKVLIYKYLCVVLLAFIVLSACSAVVNSSSETACYKVPKSELTPIGVDGLNTVAYTDADRNVYIYTSYALERCD